MLQWQNAFISFKHSISEWNAPFLYCCGDSNSRHTFLCCATRNLQHTCLRPVFSPLHIHCGNVEGDSFEPQHHEETLGEGTVADALTIAACLRHTNRENVHNNFRFGLTMYMLYMTATDQQKIITWTISYRFSNKYDVFSGTSFSNVQIFLAS